MSADQPVAPLPPARTKRAQRARLALLLACLGAAIAYLLATQVLAGSPPSRFAAIPCTYRGPEVRSVAPGALGALRESVIRVLPARLGRLYEEGTVMAANAWNDAVPAPPPLSPTAPRPAGYEMRWWAPNGDDIVADVFSFASGASAERFLTQAAGGQCRHAGRSLTAPAPPGSRDLEWVNPDFVTQADVYLARGTSVYRVADVPADQHGGRISAEQLRRALVTVDTLACLLPKAGCGHTPTTAVPV